MVNILTPVVRVHTPLCFKKANFPGLDRRSRSGRYYACKELGGIRREHSLGTCDRKNAERRLKDWIGNAGRVGCAVSRFRMNPGR